MQLKYIAIFEKMGKRLGIDPLFIMSTALQESGWDLVHVFGTNSSSNGRPLNNLYGMTKHGDTISHTQALKHPRMHGSLIGHGTWRAI